MGEQYSLTMTPTFFLHFDSSEPDSLGTVLYKMQLSHTLKLGSGRSRDIVV